MVSRPALTRGQFRWRLWITLQYRTSSRLVARVAACPAIRGDQAGLPERLPTRSVRVALVVELAEQTTNVLAPSERQPLAANQEMFTVTRNRARSTRRHVCLLQPVGDLAVADERRFT